MAAIFALICALLGLVAVTATAILVFVRARGGQLRLATMVAAHPILEADWRGRQTAVVERLTTDVRCLGDGARSLIIAVVALQSALMTLLALVQGPQTGVLRALTNALPWLRGILSARRG